VGSPNIWKKAYQVLSWSTIAVLLLTLILVLRKSPPPSVAYDPQAAARAEKKFEAADLGRAAGGTPQIELNPSELTSYLQKNLQLEGSAPSERAAQPVAPGADPATAQAPASDPVAAVAGADQATLEQVQSSVKDVKVDMDGDLVKAYVIFNFHGKDLSLELDGHLGSENGYIKFDPVAGKLGSLPLPQSTLDAAVEKMMNSPENREKLKLPSDVSDIQIKDGQAVVTYNK
jgi:hypothetical protein